jgi:hypothetical protein
MRDIILKIKYLFFEIGYALANWKTNVWDVDLDDTVCCSGKQYVYPCGCMGTTHREQLRWNYERK